jgi:hypothetical protein
VVQRLISPLLLSQHIWHRTASPAASVEYFDGLTVYSLKTFVVLVILSIGGDSVGSNIAGSTLVCGW